MDCIPTFTACATGTEAVLNPAGSEAQFARWQCSISRGILRQAQEISDSLDVIDTPCYDFMHWKRCLVLQWMGKMLVLQDQPLWMNKKVADWYDKMS